MEGKEIIVTMLKICRRALVLTAVALCFALGDLTIRTARTGFTYEYMRAFLRVLLPGALLMAVLGTATAFLRRGKVAAKEKTPRLTPYVEKEMPKKNFLRGMIIALAVLLIVLGIANGGLWDVLVKAINICTECIGLG